MTTAPRLYTIAPGVPFVDALAAGMVARLGDGDPFALARATVLLPTRRAVRSLREAFARVTNGRALLLPRMMPLGDIDEDELIVTSPADAGAAFQPVIGGLRRQLLLARLVLGFGGARWAEADPAQAAELAAELARLLDSLETERKPLSALETLSPDDENLARHWGDVLTFLRIITEHWPEHLKEEGAIGPATRRDALLAARARAWSESPPRGWVVAAGSTGSIPATADLLACVAGLPRGCVVLPGLDRDTPDATWDELPETHVQFGLARLLRRIGVGRDAVREWSDDWPSPVAPAQAAPRARLIGAALSGDGRLPDAADIEAASAGLSWVECPAPADEAAVIALVLRGALENPETTAALVTPDRDLARRVAARLKRWDIAVDDSAGRPLAATPAATFLRLVGEMAAARFAAVPLLACLKHPLAAGGLARKAHLDHVRNFDRLVLRGPATGPGLDALTARIQLTADAAARRGNTDRAAEIEAMLPWLDSIAALVAPMTDAMIGKPRDVAALARAHAAVGEALAATDDTPGAARLWRGDEAEPLAAFISDLTTSAAGFPPLRGRDYPALFHALLAGRVVRPRFGRHPRLHIWGPLEARLQHADVMILGGLNEGSWPPDVGNDPWMSRPMRRKLGLPLPERRIGLAAHDFAQAFCAPRVMLIRAHRVGGTPTVPSRWLQRLANALGEEATDALKLAGAAWLKRVEAAEHRLPPALAARPAPVPALELRPRRLSVTEIETWQINPYAIYARHVLGLAPLDAIAADPGAAERGSFIHDVMEQFHQRFPRGVPEGGAATFFDALCEIATGIFGPAGIAPGLRAIWWPRFVDIARWVSQEEVRRRATLRPLAAETSGRLRIEARGGPFALTGRADRIDAHPDGRLEIVDYKTGQPPSQTDQKRGFAPQLPLLAAMAEAGVFEGVRPAEVAEMAYWYLKGGVEGGEVKPFARETGVGTKEAVAAAVDGLRKLIDHFDTPDTAYDAYPVPGRMPRFDDYDHLARASEWATDTGGEGGED
jgi:ATP-dependent helicase/nuclease subunit B